ncbi:helicase-related protein [Capillibacterium thermochitinicola]|uniref:DUF3883 domain-containing protein n=1 Tax=Capillibacterium thermochitinicola TaxID=2699427 RepID=A0A8J6I158_9FIRM|nr:helicase-related protein [Capillibacterium thermochitinicola]MBA2133541.1 DUF3883 domain-containing protein [Capillibacterium thermochitinicola]
MARLEELTPGTVVNGLLPNKPVTVINVQWHGSDVVEVTYKDSSGLLGNELVFRDREPELEIAKKNLPWSFTGDAALFKLVSEAYRIRLAYLFDPLLAVHTSLLEPLPHQITAVYGEMLNRQPLRFLLADDPGAGKTIMTGLLIKELLIRGDLNRCLICAPGNLVEQWQDELYQRFQLPFTIITREQVEASISGNPFAELNLVIIRLDHVSRNEELQAKLEQTDWDLIICDEAHKMSASYFGGEVKFTKRYRLGQLLSRITRHFLLLTATPHNGKEEDFQLFMALLDPDRFEGRFREGVHRTDVSDLMRRMVKEDLLKFDGHYLFPERIAYTVNYELSPAEAELYKLVTDYVREEFNRAEALTNEGRKGTVGFALTILQRRLASSPEAIYQSLRRRRERLETRLREEKLLKKVADRLDEEKFLLTDEELEDLEDTPEAEMDTIEATIIDQATAAQTIAELEAEIEKLKFLEQYALRVRNSGKDRKWEELSRLLQSPEVMFDKDNNRRKLVIFTEHRDTLFYLANRIRTLLGREEAVVTIHGGMGREERRKAQEAFTQDKEVAILLATDAAGEGINLQRAHLMVNYDLPWNPNRIEQRFGRIHRIGQTEVCHLWNLVAMETREGEVFLRLFTKMEEQRKALGGRVFDILGKITFDNKPLRDLLLEAIRYGDRPEVRARLHQVVEDAFDREKLRALIEDHLLAKQTMDLSQVMTIKAELERAQARKLQPHFISAFFLAAFQLLGGSFKEREANRYEITHVPLAVRSRSRITGIGGPVLVRYERVCFEKELINLPGKPQAVFLCPGHPLLEATIDLILERYQELLREGTVLVDPNDPGEEIRLLFYLKHSIQDGQTDRSGKRRIISRRLQFVEMRADESGTTAGYAPYLDYRPLQEEEKPLFAPLLETGWWQKGLEEKAINYAIQKLVPDHLAEVKNRREELIYKTIRAVKDRLTKEINYWDRRAQELKADEQAGKINARINSEKAQRRADELQARLKKRLSELEEELRISPLPPVLIGAALVVPIGLLEKQQGIISDTPDAAARAKIEKIAMEAVLAAEKKLGCAPKDVSRENRGYDIESRNPATGKLRFIEVKGRVAGARTVTVTKNEILTGLNKPDDFILAIVLVDGEEHQIYYIRKPFTQEPGFGVESINFSLTDLLSKATGPLL